MPIVKLYPSIISPVLAWTNPDNAKADDGVYAITAGTRNANHDLVASGFNHSIPPGSVINSVIAEVQYKLSTTASVWTGTLQKQVSGVLRGTATTITTEPTVDTVVTANGGVVTYDDLVNLQVLFRVRRTSTTACNYSVDYIAVTVNYTEPSFDFSRSGSMEATGEISAIGIKSTSGSGEMTALGTMDVMGEAQTATYDYTGSGTMTGTGSNEANGIKEARAPTTALSVSGTIQADGIKQASGDGIISGTGEASAEGTKQAMGSGELVAIASMTASGSAETPTYNYSGHASMEATSQMTAEGFKNAEGDGSITTHADTTSQGIPGMFGEGVIESSSVIHGVGSSGELFRVVIPFRVVAVMNLNGTITSMKEPIRTVKTLNKTNRVVIIIDN